MLITCVHSCLLSWVELKPKYYGIHYGSMVFNYRDIITHCASLCRKTILSSTQVNPTRFNKSSAVAKMGSRLATTDMGRNVWGGGCCVPFSGGELAPHLTRQCGLAEAYLCTKWHLDPSSMWNEWIVPVDLSFYTHCETDADTDVFHLRPVTRWVVKVKFHFRHLVTCGVEWMMTDLWTINC